MAKRKRKHCKHAWVALESGGVNTAVITYHCIRCGKGRGHVKA